MMRRAFFVVGAIAAFAAGAVGCGGGGGGGVGTVVLAVSFKNAPEADVSGQSDVFTGTLGTGVTFTFTAIQGVTYNLSASSSPSGEVLVFDVFGKDGSQLKGRSFTTNGGVGYLHEATTQHVLVLLRPNNPINTGVQITSLRVTGTGPFSQTTLGVNLIVAGDTFTGFGAFNDLVTLGDRNAFTVAVGQRVQTLLNGAGAGITVTFTGYSLTTAAVKGAQPSLVDTNDLTICRASEVVGPTGFAEIDTTDLDRYGTLGIATPDLNLDVFLVHHFATNGVVGLSPRPGIAIKGSGPGTAIAAGAFLQQGGQIVGSRTVNEIALVIVHEIGHFLGLLHTTTFSPSSLVGQVNEAIDDGLADTPPAGTTTDANGDGLVGLGDGCADENNIMFYQAKATQSVLSPRQVGVVKTTLSALEH